MAEPLYVARASIAKLDSIHYPATMSWAAEIEET